MAFAIDPAYSASTRLCVSLWMRHRRIEVPVRIGHILRDGFYALRMCYSEVAGLVVGVVYVSLTTPRSRRTRNAKVFQKDLFRRPSPMD